MNFIEEWGSIAGLAGLAIGVFAILFRSVIQKKIFAKLTRKQSFLIIILFMALVSLMSVYSIWIYYSHKTQAAKYITVLVHGKNGKDDLVLPNRGEVKLIYGDAIVVEKINAKGEATFKQIPDVFFDKNPPVHIMFHDPKGEPYYAINPDSSYHLIAGRYIPLEVTLQGLSEIKGIVKNFETGAVLDSVRVSILGTSTYSNTYGEFHLKVPPSLQQKYQTVRALKNGFEMFEMADVPIQTKTEFPILLKPKKP
ncbi:hypothetical protein [Aquimarina longa]|uniref:hypothetical protein n=1 Tax=Aquimarina longa TaxID=1080221 RepID=UPI0007835D16|nr:hypothetical protein [Aquimarina longa]